MKEVVVIKFIADVIVSLTFNRPFTFCWIVMSGWFRFICVRTKILTHKSDRRSIWKWPNFTYEKTKKIYIFTDWHTSMAFNTYTIYNVTIYHSNKQQRARCRYVVATQHHKRQKFLMHPICLSDVPPNLSRNPFDLRRRRRKTTTLIILFVMYFVYAICV